MEFNNKKLARTSKILNYIIAIVLCGFLISLTGSIMADLDNWTERPSSAEFMDNDLIRQNRDSIDSIDLKISVIVEKRNQIQNTISVANANYRNAKQSFDNWLAARETVGSPTDDKEVTSRANALDEFYKTEQEWQAELAKVNREISDKGDEMNVFDNIIREEENRAFQDELVALRKHDMNVFLIRLLVILPILLLGIFFIFKFRKHKYWPLFLGFVLFSFYAFFFGLVPYLPSYGGYIRYTVGIILCILLGAYAINKIKAFMERKAQELKVSTSERSKKVRTETAEKALDDHMCPSCGKDFIMKKWDKSIGKKTKEVGAGVVTNFCRFCGLVLFKPCGKCGEENFAHLPFCSSCGDPMSASEQEVVSE